MKSGIYKIVNKNNGRLYIGSAKNVQVRCGLHRSALRGGRHPNRYLQAAWAKYGEASFAFEQIEQCPVGCLLQREQFWIDEHGFDELYNLRPQAASQLGIKWSPETLAKMKAAAQRRAQSPEWRKKISEAQKGRVPAYFINGKPPPVTDETRKRMSLAHKTRPPQSPETRARRAETLKRVWDEQKRLGVGKFSPEALARTSASNKAAWDNGTRKDNHRKLSQ